MFCRKVRGEFLFRDPVAADFLETRARRDHLLPQHEVPVGDFQAAAGEVVKKDNVLSLKKSQQQSAMSHWRIMRTVIPAKVWEMW